MEKGISDFLDRIFGVLGVFYFLDILQVLLLFSYRKYFRDWKNVRPVMKSWIHTVILVAVLLFFITFMETFFPMK